MRTLVPLSEILEARSCDASAYGNARTVEDVIEYKMTDSGFQSLVDSIREHGLAEGFEPCYEDGYLTEGYHRVAAMMVLGYTEIPVQPLSGRHSQAPFTTEDGATPGACAHCVGCARWGEYR